MNNDRNQIRTEVLSWLNRDVTPERALYRLLVIEWEIPPDLVSEVLGHEDTDEVHFGIGKSQETLGLMQVSDVLTYYCEDHDFGTNSPQSWAAHHTHADHVEEGDSS